MRVGVLAIELNGDLSKRCLLYSNILDQLRSSYLDLLIFPGGFFCGANWEQFSGCLKMNPPNVTLVVGWDEKPGKKNKSGKIQKRKREVWAVSRKGQIKMRIQEAWGRSDAKEVLKKVSERRCLIDRNDVDLYCCGDVLIDERKFEGEIVAVTAHCSAKGRAFSRAMRSLEKPAFLSHFVKHPYKTTDFAYCGTEKLKSKEPIQRYFQEKIKWQARIYNI